MARIKGGHHALNLVECGSEYPPTKRGKVAAAQGVDLARVRCSAMSRQTGLRCAGYSCHGQTLCMYHGGTHVPVEVLVLAKGRYDEVIGNASLLEKYKRLKKDDDLTSQEDDLALLRAMCEVIVERAFKSDTPVASMSTDAIAAVTAMLERVDRLVSSISERESRQKLTIRVAEIAKVIDRVFEVVGKYVKDPGTMQAIGRELANVSIPDADPSLPRLPKQITSEVVRLEEEEGQP